MRSQNLKKAFLSVRKALAPLSGKGGYRCSGRSGRKGLRKEFLDRHRSFQKEIKRTVRYTESAGARSLSDKIPAFKDYAGSEVTVGKRKTAR